MSRRTERDTRRFLERERQAKTFGIGPTDNVGQPAVRHERWARTTTRTQNPTYPSPPATKFVVEFGDYYFDDTTTGNETAVFTAYTPQETKIAYSRFGWLPQNTVVRVSLHHGRWYIRSDYTLVRHKAKTTSTISDGGSGTVNIWLNGAVSSPLWQVTAWLNWMNGTSTIASGKEVIIEWFQDEANGAGKWVIVAMEC